MAFALQEVIVSLAGWLHIMIVGSVSVGQRVKIADVKGDIIDIGILSTTMMETGDWIRGDLYNGRIVTLSNSFVFKEKVHKLLRPNILSSGTKFKYPYVRKAITSRRRRCSLKCLDEVCGDYANRSKDEWQKMANKYRIEDAQVEPMVTLEIHENWILFTLRYIVDYKKRRFTKDMIYTRILEELNKPEAKFELATSTLEVTSLSLEPQQ